MLVVFAGLFGWVAFSLGSALTNPALGQLVRRPGRRVVARATGRILAGGVGRERVVLPPPAQGRRSLAPGSIHAPKSVTTLPAAATVQHLPAPAPVVPLASPPVTGEGQWSPVGRLVDGVPAVYETMLRPSAIHTSYVVGVAWIDTTLLKSMLYSGSQIPGGGPYSHTAPVSPSDATSLVAAFNAGFLMGDAEGGYYTDGKTIVRCARGRRRSWSTRTGTPPWANGAATCR